MKEKKIILLGGGGHCKSCIDVIESTGLFQIVGILDSVEKKGIKILGYEIIGNDNEIEKLIKSVDFFLITVGQIKNPGIRIKLFNVLKTLNAKIPVIVSPNAYVSAHAKISSGSIIMHHAIVNAGVTIGENCIINTKALVEHDTIVGNHCHISTGAILNGGVIVGDNSFIGSGAVTKENITIIEGSFIKANSIVK